MSYLFSKVLEMSLYGSIAILVVLLFRLIFKKCPKKVMILFWIIVALRLVLPFNFNSPTSLLNFGKLVQPKTVSAEPTTYDPETRLREIAVVDTAPVVVEQNAPDTAVIDNGSDAPETAPVVTEQAPKVTFKSVLPYIWLTVMVGMLIFSAIRYAIFYSRARWSSRSFDGRYYMANDIDSPFVVGIINPKIFFPINMDDDEREYVLNHEWTHIKNKDGLTKLLSYIVLCIHWFNPLVWLAFFMLCADIEMRVDEETTSNFNLSMVKEYCKSLVRHAADDNKGAFMQSTAFSGLSFGGMETKMRIKNLLAHKITSKEIQIASICVTLVFSLLVSASSIDHQPWVREKPSEPGESAAVATSDTTESTPSEATTETTKTRRWDAAFIDPYIEFINQSVSDNEANKAYYKYAFIYVDDDLIPELVLEKPTEGANNSVSLYTFKNGKVTPVFEDGVKMEPEEAYYYVPFEDFIVYHKANTAGTQFEDKLYSLNDLISGAAPKGKGLSEDPSYSIDGKTVTQNEYFEYFRNRELELICGKVKIDKAIRILEDQKTSGGTKIPSDISDDPEVTGTVETTTETTAEPEVSVTPTPTSAPVNSTEATMATTAGTAQTTASPKYGSVKDMKDGKTLPFDYNNNTGTLECDYGSFYYERGQSADKVHIVHNGKSYSLNIYTDRSKSILLNASLIKANGKAYIYINTLLKDNSFDVSVYEVSDSDIKYNGHCTGIALPVDIKDPYRFNCSIINGDDLTISLSRDFKVASKTGLPVVADYMCRVKALKDVKAARDITGYIVRNGKVTTETMTIKAGDPVSPGELNEVSYFDIQDINSGNVVRVDFEPLLNEYYAMNDERWVYRAILSLIRQA